MYFTAHVKSLPNSPDAPARQQIYLRALRTLRNLEIIYGHFLSHHVRMPLANPGLGQPKTVEVIKTEEKGSDVNLAIHLLHDPIRIGTNAPSSSAGIRIYWHRFKS